MHMQPLVYKHSPKDLSFRTGISGSASSIQTICAKADIAFVRNLLPDKQLKGILGEHFAESLFLKGKLEAGIQGNWTSVTPRTGPQGIDHLFMKIDSKGNMSWLVGESKYGTSQLSTTVGGDKQLSPPWVIERLKKIGGGYLNCSELTDIQIQRLPKISPKIQYDITLSDGNKVSFWQDEKNTWIFSGNKNELSEAQAVAQKMGKSLKDNTNFNVRLFRIEAKGKSLCIKIESVDSNGKKELIDKINLDHYLDKKITTKEAKDVIAKALLGKMKDVNKGLTTEEIKKMTDELVEKYKRGELLESPMPVWKGIALQSLVTFAVSGILDVGIQLFCTQKIHFGKSVLTAGSAGLGSVTGQALSIGLLRSNIGNQMVRSLSNFMNLSYSMTRNVLAGSTGGIVTTLLMSYGGYFLGFTKLKEANRVALGGSASCLGGPAASAGVYGLVATFGTCSTGTSIATLTGAAATKATLAWLGGGPVAAGGFGVAGGIVVLGGITVIVSIGISVGIASAFAWRDRSKNREYQLQFASSLNHMHIWLKVAERYYQPTIY